MCASMNGLPYYKAYPRDFFEGTVHLSLEVKSAYRLLLDLIYMHGGKLYDEPRFIAGQFGCSVKRWNILRAEIIGTGKVVVIDGFLRNLRADQELEILRSFQDKQRENASGPRKNNGLKEATVKPKSSQPEPEPEPHKTEAKASVSWSISKFEEFWTIYPHRNGTKKKRKDCEAKYRAAVKSGASEQTIIDGAKRASLDRQVIDGYGRDPLSWLNQAGWQDEIQSSQAKPEGKQSAFTRAWQSALSDARLADGPDYGPTVALFSPRG